MYKYLVSKEMYQRMLVVYQRSTLCFKLSHIAAHAVKLKGSQTSLQLVVTP